MSYDDTQQYPVEPPSYEPEDQPTAVMGGGWQPAEPVPPSRSAPTMPPHTPERRYAPQDAGPGPGFGARTEIMRKEEPPSTLAWLAVTNGLRRGTLFRLNEGLTSIGRDAGNDIIIDDAKASRQHAKARMEQVSKEVSQFYLHDLVSANGTWINGEEITKQALYDGDEVQIGNTTMVFKQVHGPERPAPGSDAEPAAPDAA